MNPLTQYLYASRRAEKIVTKRGISAWLIVICAALICFLMLYTLSLSRVASGVANTWRDALSDSATIRLQAPQGEMEEEAAAVAQVLGTAPGVESFSEITTDDQLQLLAPWLGADIPLEVLSLPRVYTVKIKPEEIDEEAISTRLSAEAPHAVWDNHIRWRGPLLDSADRIRNISLFSTMLIAVAFVLLIWLAAEASIAANSTTILLLRQIGATDRWIQSGFERKFVIRSLLGGLIGVVFGLLAYSIAVRSQLGQSDLAQTQQNLMSLPLGSAVFVVICCVIFGYVATRVSTARYLKSNT